MNRWFEFYKSRINNKSYEEYFQKKYNPYLSYLSSHIKPKMKIGEFGCGTSLVTKLLYKENCSFVVGDNNKEMLELTSTNLNNNRIKKYLIDIKNPIQERFDLIYSHGVLEHFDYEQIRKIIENQLKVCGHLVHYVPSDKYKVPSFGDERLWSVEKWSYYFTPTKVIEFNNGYDLMLIWRKQNEKI